VSRSLTLFVLLAAACSGDDTTATPARVQMTVRLVEEPLLVDDPSDRPIAAAEVAFDMPRDASGNRERVTAVTDADGRATFDVAEDALRGDAVVTMYSPEHLSYSRLDVTEREVTLVVPRLDAATSERTVQLTGAISGRAGTTTVDLSASKIDRLGRAITDETTYAMRIPRAQPFFLVGQELDSKDVPLKSFRIDVPAKDSDSRLDVDLASVTPLAPRTIRMRVTPPASMAAGATIFANVVSAESSLFLGAPTKVEDGAIELAVIDTDLGGEHALTRGVVIASDGARSIRTEVGVVADDTTFGDLLAPPKVAEASRLKTDPIPITDFPDGAALRVEMIAGGKLGWILVGPKGGLREKTIALPPSFRVEFPRLVAVTIAAQMDPIDIGGGRTLYRRVGVSRDVLLNR
jgi:hypothetical protein